MSGSGGAGCARSVTVLRVALGFPFFGILQLFVGLLLLLLDLGQLLLYVFLLELYLIRLVLQLFLALAVFAVRQKLSLERN